MKKTIRFSILILLMNIAAAEQPTQETLILFDAAKDANKTKIEPVGANTSFTSAGTLLVETEPNKDFPGVIFKPMEDAWNLSQYLEVSAQLSNPGTEPIRLYLRIDNPNANMWSNSNLQAVLLKPGEKRNLSTFVMLGPWRFDKPITLIGMRGSPGDKGGMNPAKVTQVCIMTDKTHSPRRFEI